MVDVAANASFAKTTFPSATIFAKFSVAFTYTALPAVAIELLNLNPSSASTELIALAYPAVNDLIVV